MMLFLRRWLRPVLAASLLTGTLALVATATALAVPPSFAPMAAAPIIVSVDDGAVAFPATLAPGFETLAIANAGTMQHNLTIFRLNDGVTVDQALAAGQAITADPASQAAFYALAVPYGGADTLDPGAGQTLTESFDAGQYLAVDTNGMDGPHASFVVSGTPTGAAPPAQDWQVTEEDFFFSAPTTVPAGMSTVEVTNVGAQNHMMVLVRLDPDKTIQDVIDYLMSSGPDAPQPDWAHSVPGVPELGPGLSAYTVLTLDPGTYVMLCFDTDPTNGLPHVAEGMIGTFVAQ